jgi:hypothetical protein
MSYEIAILNPRPKRDRKGRFIKATHRKRHKARKTRKAPRRRRPAAKTINPRRRRYVRMSNPRRKRRYVRMSNPHRRRRRHSNPRFSLGGITSQLMPAAIGAGAAVALDVTLGFLTSKVPMPAMLQSGWGKQALRVGGALGIGYAGRRFFRGRTGDAIAMGALFVAMYGVVKQLVVQFAPTLPGLGDYEYVTVDTADQIGDYTNPAAQIGAYMRKAGPMGAYMDHRIGHSGSDAGVDIYNYGETMMGDLVEF